MQLLYKWMGEEMANGKKWLVALERSAWPVIVAAFSTFFLCGHFMKPTETIWRTLLPSIKFSFVLLLQMKYHTVSRTPHTCTKHPLPRPHIGPFQPSRYRISQTFTHIKWKRNPTRILFFHENFPQLQPHPTLRHLSIAFVWSIYVFLRSLFHLILKSATQKTLPTERKCTELLKHTNEKENPKKKK